MKPKTGENLKIPSDGSEMKELFGCLRESDWMTIDTAPKEKIEILAWSKRHGINVGILTPYKRPEMPSRKGGWFLPTHWMPLPKPPSVSSPVEK